MTKGIFEAPHFSDPEAARVLVEGIRWPDGPVCGHCGETARRYTTKRPGRYRCGNPECRKDYTVTTGMVMESSHIPLHKWLMGFHLAASSKKGISAHQLHRTLGITYKSAWFMEHRIREAMREGGLLPPLGGKGQAVEVDETYWGKVTNPRKTSTRTGKPLRKISGAVNKCAIVSLVERGGKVRSFHVPRADKPTVTKIVRDNIAHESNLYTDESALYRDMDQFFNSHESVIHARKEYARGNVHVNTAEGFFSVFKRGMRGVYQHCDEKHLHRYVAEFDFRYNRRASLGYTDEMRTTEAIAGAVGKRLTYKKRRAA